MEMKKRRKKQEGQKQTSVFFILLLKMNYNWQILHKAKHVIGLTLTVK